MSEHQARVSAYLDRRDCARGIDTEHIHGLDGGGDDPGFLLLQSDLRALLADLERAEKALAALAQQAPPVDRPVDPEGEINAAWSVIGAEQGSPRSVAFRDGAHWQRGQDTKSLSDTSAQQTQPVHQFRRRLCADWYDGHPDHEDGGGPYETRILYTAQQAQPVDELPDLNPEDIVVDVVLKQLGGFAPVTTHGVRVTHKPSRISVVVDSERSQHRNRQLALEALRAILALRPTVEPMTNEQMRKAAMDEMSKIPALANHHSWKGWPGTWAFATAAVNGITAKAEGGA